MAFVSQNNVYAVGVGDFIAYKNGEFAAMGKVNTETMMEFTASYLDIRAGKRGKLVARYAHSSNATFSIVAANYSPAILKASMGGQDISYGYLPKEESLTMATRTLTLTETPKEVGDINSKVWIKYDGLFVGAISASSTTVVIPSTSPFNAIPDNATVCAIYNYQNINASTFTMPAEVQPEIWHIFIDIDLCSDKSGAGIIGRQVVEIPLAQLSPEQTINATMDGYSESKLAGVMLADMNGVNACGGHGVYAYITTEIDNALWYDSVFGITNDIDNVELGISSTYALQLLALQYGGSYISLDSDYYGDLSFTFDEGTATGTTFNDSTGVITSGSTAGTATLEISIPNKTAVPTYTLEIVVA